MVYNVQAQSIEINAKNVASWVQNFENNIQANRITLGQYYDGQNTIQKQGAIKGRPNYQINVNMAKYITDVATSYVFGKPITYATDDETNKQTMDKLQYINKNTKVADIDFEVGGNMSVYGVGYQLVMVKEGTEPIEDRIIVKNLNPESTFIVVDNTILANPICAVYFYTYTINDKPNTKVYVYDKENLTIFDGELSNLKVEQEATPHLMGMIPILQTLNNDDGFGDYQQVQGLLDSLSLAMSNSTDNLQSIANAILAIYGAILNKDQIEIINDTKVLNAQGQGVKAEWLIKDINPEAERMQIDNLLKFIFQISQVPDLTDEAFGGNQSGVAMQFKLWGIDQLWTAKVREYTKTIYDRITIFINLLKYDLKKPVDLANAIQLTFSKNLPSGKSEEYEMVRALKGVISDKTLLENISLVDDVDMEMKQIKQERKEEADSYGFNNNGALDEQ